VLPDADEKRAIIDACETFIRDVLKPRFLPDMKQADETVLIDRICMIDISGSWIAGRYRWTAAELLARPEEIPLPRSRPPLGKPRRSVRNVSSRSRGAVMGCGGTWRPR
jgi:hypothetical protein